MLSLYEIILWKHEYLFRSCSDILDFIPCSFYPLIRLYKNLITQAPIVFIKGKEFRKLLIFFDESFTLLSSALAGLSEKIICNRGEYFSRQDTDNIWFFVDILRRTIWCKASIYILIGIYISKYLSHICKEPFSDLITLSHFINKTATQLSYKAFLWKSNIRHMIHFWSATNKTCSIL